MKRLEFLGYPVDQISMDEVMSWITSRAQESSVSVISVINANKLWLARNDPRLQQIIHHSALVIPEYAVVWGAKQLGLPPLHPVYGVALTRAFMDYAAQNGLRPFFLGATEETIEVLKTKLASQYPQLKPAGFHHGYLKTPEIQALALQIIRSAAADVLFVAMGSPRQEFWISENKEGLNVPVVIGVGGTLDVLAGIKEDTPSSIRGSGFEWLYRLSLDPGQYWRRYMITNPWFVWQIVKEKRARRRAPDNGSSA